MITAFIYLRYTSKVYTSTAKIKVLDKKESSFELPSAEDLFSHSKINLENEVEILKSYPILEKVVGNLNLTTSFVAIGDIMRPPRKRKRRRRRHHGSLEFKGTLFQAPQQLVAHVEEFDVLVKPVHAPLVGRELLHIIHMCAV